jgi:hypothetical protein
VAHDIGRIILIAGLILVILGLAVMFFGRIPLVGRLPGDIHIRRGNLDLYIPIATSLALSILVTLILWAVSRCARK